MTSAVFEHPERREIKGKSRGSRTKSREVETAEGYIEIDNNQFPAILTMVLRRTENTQAMSANTAVCGIRVSL